jgi:hypothetical protein
LTGSNQSVFRRCVIVDATQDVVHAAIEDDFHHYELQIRHANGLVTAAKVNSIRTPWVICGEAGARMADLIGHPISTRPEGLPDPHHQCTHMFELAVVALGQAVRGGYRRYDVAIPHRKIGDTTRATLHRDKELILTWHMNGDTIEAPPPFAGENVRKVLPWASATFDDDMFEAIKVLRRSVHVSGGRSVQFDRFAGAADIKHVLGACYAFQPERVARARRNPDTRRDFTSTPDLPLTGFATIPENKKP